MTSHPEPTANREPGRDPPTPQAELARLRARLLDLTKRTSLLNWRATRGAATAVAVVDEMPAEVYRILVVEEKAMRFRPDPKAEDGEGTMALDDEEPMPPVLESSVVAAERHVDLWLQTRLSSTRLDQYQRRIADRCESIREEQGVNTLFLALGLLHYYESDSSDELRRAPILLLPVELERPAANRPFRLTIADDDIVINPALVEMLKHQFGVALPELPEEPERIDVRGLFSEIGRRVAPLKRWRVGDEIVLSTFSFLKFVMYKDLEANEQAFGDHRLFRLLLRRRGGGMLGLPAEIQSMDLDRDRPPEETYEVVDADSSQQRAIAAVAKGHDLVVQGPPGTGKSQTIVNLIAGALAEDKTVLFVSEKRAALDVVQRRLRDVGLGDFCLELHSQKASKREVARDIARSLDRTLVATGATERLRSRIPATRAKLLDYVRALHTKHEPLGLSVYEAVGRLAWVKDAPWLPWPGTAGGVSGEELRVAEDAVEGLAIAAGPIGDPGSHPWRETTLERVGALYATDRARLREVTAHVQHLAAEAMRLTHQAEAALGVVPAETLPEAREAAVAADLMDASPGAPVEVLTSSEWNAPPPNAIELIEIGRRATERRERAQRRFRADTLKRSHAPDIATVLRYRRKLYRMLVPQYRATRRAWLECRAPGYQATLGEQAAHLREVDGLRIDVERLARDDALGSRLFGRHWRGADSDWDVLEGYVRWVVAFRGACLREQLQQTEAASAVANGAPPTDTLRRLAQVGEHLAQRLAELGEIVGWPIDHLQDATLDAIGTRTGEMLEGEPRQAEWVAYLRKREEVNHTIGAPFLVALDRRDVSSENLPAAFRRSFHEAWTTDRVRASPALKQFEATIHEADIQAFRQLDLGVLRENRDRLVSLLRLRAQERLRQHQQEPGWAFLQSQLVRQRGHAPVRKLLQRSLAPLRAIKPCFMMSPLMVAQCLPADPSTFDLVIFDEASQLTPQDAIGAVVRARQLAVVGDQRQLPPTNFFDVQLGSGDSADGAGDDEGLQDLESILEQYQAAGLPSARLRWHYRSRHESLIAFSNANVYEWDLLTFPSAETDNRARGLAFQYVAAGVYLGSGLNLVEARRVVDAVLEHGRRHPDQSLGVGTFNLRQQLAIQDELERRRREDPSLEPFFGLDKHEPFFVKNLENVQGDERDVIFLSVTYAKGPDGILRHNFGPINGQNGPRRLNVLITRARERMVVFSSMRGDEIDLTKTQAKGAQMLRDFLLYAERGQLVNARLLAELAAESPFEREVLSALAARGLTVVPQVGVGPFRIDIGVLDDELPGRFICGIECDGAAYHQSETARDRDRLREEVLRRLGWRICRVWSTDWFKYRQAQVERLLKLIEQARQEARVAPRGAVTGPPPAAPDPSEQAAPDLHKPSPPAPPRPVAKTPTYRMAQVGTRGTAEELLFAPDRAIGAVIVEVVKVEGPLHEDDLFSRVAAAWSARRVGIRIQRRLRRVLQASAARGEVAVEGSFVSIPGEQVTARSRAGTDIPAERIARAEYCVAVLLVLRSGPRPREALMADARGLLGFDRTGPKLEERLAGAISTLLAQGRIGQASTGLVSRDGPAVSADVRDL